ncbi:hypothetical protein GGF31_000722 [Allomyces arbusculus]|nr:hypothetical protein GGF31_000722 [Allomyces arbusculus]
MVPLIHGAGASSSFSPAISPTKADPALDLPPSYAAGGAPPPAYSDSAGFTAASVPVGDTPSSLPESPADSAPSPRSAFALRLFPFSLTIGDLFTSGSDLAFAGVFAALFFLSAMFDLTWLFSYRTSQMPRARMRIFLIFTLITAVHWWLAQSALWEVAFFQLLVMSGDVDTTTTFFSPSVFMVVCLVSRIMTLVTFRQAMGRRVAPN